MPTFGTTPRYSIAALAGVGVLGWCTGAAAGDYMNECKSADGGYITFEGALERSGDPAGTSLPYRIIEDQLMSETEGYCLSSDPNAKGAQFKYLSRSWRQTVVIERAGGKPETVQMTCELAASGLPAAFNCDTDVVTKTKSSPGPRQSWRVGAKGTWSHNGSAMKLEADGAARRFIYMNPRVGLLGVGVRPEMVLFEGVRDGNIYSGTARYWSKRCGEQPFAVSGTVSDDERVVTLSGTAPKLDTSCKITGKSAELLVFERH